MRQRKLDVASSADDKESNETRSSPFLERQTGLFRSTANVVPSVQDALRTIVWDDPFYHNRNEDVIAVFDISKAEIKCLRRNFYLSIAVALATVVLICFVPQMIFVLLLWFWNISDTSKHWDTMRRRHVAVTSRGVFVDLSDESSGHQLAHRKIFEYHKIKSCSLNDVGWLRPTYRVEFTTSSPVDLFADNGISGLSNAQGFVDVVTALMENSMPKATVESADDGILPLVPVEST